MDCLQTYLADEEETLWTNVLIEDWKSVMHLNNYDFDNVGGMKKLWKKE